MVAQRCRPACRRLLDLADSGQVLLAEGAVERHRCLPVGQRRGDVCRTLGRLLRLMACAAFLDLPVTLGLGGSIGRSCC